VSRPAYKVGDKVMVEGILWFDWDGEVVAHASDLEYIKVRSGWGVNYWVKYFYVHKVEAASEKERGGE
jgi:hypothetical protein